MSDFLCAGLYCVVPIAVGLLSNVVGYQFLRRSPSNDSDSKVREILIGGLLTLLSFSLVLSLSNARETHLRALSAATEEVLQCRLLYEDLGVLGKSDAIEKQTDAQGLVLEYANNVIDCEWEVLQGSSPRLDEGNGILLNRIRQLINPNQGTFLTTRAWTGLGTIEHLRQTRLRYASEQSSVGFWVIIAVLLAMTCAMLGSTAPTKLRLVLIATFCLGVGLVCMLIMEYERPYSGWINLDARSFFLPRKLGTTATPP